MIEARPEDEKAQASSTMVVQTSLQLTPGLVWVRLEELWGEGAVTWRGRRQLLLDLLGLLVNGTGEGGDLQRGP